MTAIEIRDTYYMLLFTMGLLGMQHSRAAGILAVKRFLLFCFAKLTMMQEERLRYFMLGIANSICEERAFF